MDYPRRLAAFRERMGEAGVDLVYLPRGANLFYLTGVRRHYDHGTDHNAYGDWATGAYLGRRGGLTLLGPRMGGTFYLDEAEGKPWIEAVRLIQEAEQPLEVMRQTLAAFEPVRSLALDERTWARTDEALRGLLPEARVSLVSDLINPLRMIKDDEELAAMRAASALADKVFALVAPQLRLGASELEITQEVDYQFLLNGAESTSFQTGVYIIGPEQSGAWPNESRGGGRRLRPGDSLMFDFGCVLDGYCADFGRCAYAGEPSAEYLRVHELVLQSQQAGIDALRAGERTTAEVNAIARRVLEEAGYGDAFTQRLGHGIGVTVHEPPFLDVTDQTILRPNMVFTVEPSVLLRGKFGNRVEDVVVVTEHGGERLNSAPHALTVIQ